MPKTDREKQIAEEWRDEGLKHANPSEKTIKMFESMQKEVQELVVKTAEQQKDINNISDNVSEIKKDIKDFISSAKDCYADKKTVEDFINKAPDKFANKTTEKFVYALIGLILIGVFGIWWGSLFNKPTISRQDFNTALKEYLEKNNQEIELDLDLK